MYQSVKDAFPKFTTKFEGRKSWMYVDVKGFVTTGTGNLIDPVAAALQLPFQHANGSAATAAEITTAWNDLKTNKETLGKAGAGACEPRNDLRLSEAAMDNLVTGKLASNETTFTATFPDFASWPADAQLAAMSMSWAMGPGGFASGWPKLTASLRAKDFAAAATECKLSETGNAGVVSRNVADAALFTNAAAVIAHHADPAKLYYPGAVPAAAPPPVPTPPSTPAPPAKATPAPPTKTTPNPTVPTSAGAFGSGNDPTSSFGDSPSSDDTTSDDQTPSDADAPTDQSTETNDPGGILPGDSSTDGSTDAPTDDTTDAPSDGSTDSPADGSTDSPADGSTDSPADGSTDAPADGSTDAPADGSTDAPTDGTTDAAPDGSTDAAPDGSTDGSTDAPADGSTDAPTDESSDAPSDDPGDTSSEGATDAPADDTSSDGSSDASDGSGDAGSDQGDGSSAGSSGDTGEN